MQISFEIPFECPDDMTEHLERVFEGEYDVRVAFANPKILDLGANCGAFSVWSIHRWPGAQVQAFEPHPETFKWLERNVKPYPQIKIHNYGIGTPGLRILGEGKHNCGECSFHNIADNPTPLGQHLEVKSPMTLPEANILKMDIEGCEMEVLEPLITSGRKFNLIVLEYHNEDLRREIDELLFEYRLIGSEVQNIVGRGVVKYLHRELLK